jgi:hypothetical protein
MAGAHRAAEPPAMPPRTFRRPLVAALRAACAVLLLGGVVGCDRVADVVSPGRPGLAPARLALAARLPVLQGGVAELRVAASYDRTDGSAVPLGTQTIALTNARTQDVPVPIELGPCLNDALRRRPDGGPDGACVVRLTVALLLDARAVDEQTVGPLALQPGATAATPAPLTLHDVRVVRLDAPAGTVPLPDGSLRLEVGATAQLAAAPIDATGQAVLGRTARFVSATPAVATVGEQTGVVTGVAPGTARITASVGGRDTALTVTVVPRPQPVTVTVAGSGGGTVVSTPAGIQCRLLAGQSQGTCTFTFPGDARVSLLAVPQAGSGFGGWGDACAASGAATTCDVTADQARAVRATFTALRTVTVGGDGGNGSITSSPAGIACTVAPTGTTGACSAGFLDGVPVTLTAAPTGDDRFVSWGGACAAATGASCTFVVGEGATGASVRFARPQALTVAPSGTGEGSVAGGAIACERRSDANTGSCTAAAPFGTVVALAATPAANSTFAGWTGACSGTGACTVTIDEARTVGATFTRRQVALAVSLSGAGAGAVSVGDQRCTLATGQGSASCTLRVDVGRALALSAQPAADAEFTGWSGACAASARAPGCTLTLTADGAVGATFVPGAVRVTIGGGGGGGTLGTGTVSSSDERLSCVIAGAQTSGACEATFAVGATVTLTAAPDRQSAFDAWSGACAGTAGPRCTFTVREATSAGARFIRQQAAIIVGVGGSGAGTVSLNGTPLCTLAPAQGSVSCARIVDAGTSVTLTLQPAAGSSATWGGPCANVAVTSPCTIVATGTAVSVPVSFALTGTVSVRPVAGFTGGGRVQSTDQRIDCTIAPVTGATSGTCDVVYPAGTSVSLALTSITMETFVGAWSGLCASTTPSCTFTVPAAGGTARIALPEFVSLSVRWTGSGGVVTVFSDSAGRLQCTAVPGSFACTGVAPEGSTVTFTATSQFPGWFQGWTGACAEAGTAPVCTRTVPFRTAGDPPFTVGARFDFEALVDVTGAGTISLQGRTGPGSACTNAGTGTTTCSLRSPTPSATFVPTPAAGNALTSWGTTACFTLTPTCTVEVPGANGRISATFQAAAPALVTMNFNNSGSGTTTIAFADTATQLSRCFTVSTNGYSCSGDVPEGSVVTFTAVSAFPNGFLGWTGDCASAGTALVCTRTVPLRTASNPPYVVGARYDFGVPLGVSGGLGTVTLQSPSPGTPTTCTNPGLGETLCTLRSPTSTVTLVATPAPGYAFVGWDAVACISAGTTCTVDVGSSSRTNARFEAQGPPVVTIARDPASTSGGRVNGVNIACTLSASGTSGLCSDTVVAGSSRTYTALPFALTQFVSWGGLCAGQTGNTCTLASVTASGTVVARFDLIPPQLLTIQGGASGTAAGTVTSSPAGTPSPLNCTLAAGDRTGTCSASYGYETLASLTPTPAPGSVFIGWSGACTGAAVPCDVRMNAAQTVSAFFAPAVVNLTLAFDAASSGWGSLSVSGQEIDCTSDPQVNGGTPSGNGCSGAPVANRSSITVSASGGGPGGPNSEFVGWTGNSPCTGVQSPICTFFTLDSNTTVQARFGSLTFVSVAINNAGTTNGVVTVRSVRGTETFSVGGPNASVSNPRYFLGDSLTITASTTAPNAFSFWSGGLCGAFGSNPVCTAIVSNGDDINAVFGNPGLREPDAGAALRRRAPGQPVPASRRPDR